MPKWIMLSMVLVLAGAGAQAMERGGVDASMDDGAHAVDETKMDVAMMEGGPEVMDEEVPMAATPSVALSGSAKMGLKREDDNASTKPEDDDIKTVVEYEVKFSSSGVTDGGLVFGAAISIDEEGKGAAGSNGVNEASVHIGSAEGTWKLQFGSNDPGIDLVGNIGVANADDISGMTLTVLPLMYNHNTDATGTPDMRRAFKGSTIKPSLAGQTATVTLEGLIGSGTVYTTFDSSGAFTAGNDKALSYIKQKDVDGAISYAGWRRYDADSMYQTITGTNMPAPPPGGHTAMALTGTIESFSYALTASEAGEDTWSAGIKYDPGAFYVSAGMDYNDVKAIGAGGTFAGNTVKATYVKQDKAETYWSVAIFDFPAEKGIPYTAPRTVNEMEAYGLSVSRDIGAGSNVTLAYSRLTDKGLKPTFIGTKQWELDFTYALGGDASFYAGIEQAKNSKFENTFNAKVSGASGASERQTATLTAIAKTSKVTTLELGITMKF